MIDEYELEYLLKNNSMRAIARKKKVCHVRFHRFVKANFDIEKAFKVSKKKNWGFKIRKGRGF